MPYFDAREAFRAVLRFLTFVLIASAIVCAISLTGAYSEWRPEFALQPPEVRSWYSNAELTEAAKGRFPFKKCCDHADVVRTKFATDKIDGRDIWLWLDGDQWRRIPDDVIHWNESAPDGKPTLFVYSKQETCFFPGDGGI